MATRLDFGALLEPRNRSAVIRIAVAAFLCISLLYFVFPRTSPGGYVVPLQSGANTVPYKKPNLSNPYKNIDLSKPPKESYTRTLVIAKTKEEDASWIQNDLADILEPEGDLSTAIYIADDKNSPLHPPKNKGHEAMVYLTYIIDNYDSLPDVAIFMHFHGATWHNNDLLGTSSSKIVRSLSSEKVVRDGYMNLRCHWEPGCPSWIHPATDHLDTHKEEEKAIATAFQQLFPGDPLPVTLAQPCCAQFAVSGERIRQLPLQRYIDIRHWLETTPLEDSLSGRVFEYTWQYIFTASPVHCRNMHICYCDGYSICFASEHAYIQYLDIQDTYRAFRDDLSALKEANSDSERQVFLQRNIDDLLKELGRRKEKAIEEGEDRKRKYEILRDSWQELTEHPPGHLAEKYGHFGVDSDII